MNPSIVVTGMGLSTALGRGLDQNWRRLVSGESGMRPIKSLDLEGSAVRDGGEAPALPAEDDDVGSVPDGRARALAHLEHACRDALAAAGITEGAALDPDRTALILGSSLAASSSSPAFWNPFIGDGPAAPDYRDLRSYDVEPFIAELAARLRARGPTTLVSNACAAGASSIALAADLLAARSADLALAGGYDTLELHTFAGFGALGALAAEPMQPFGRERAGMKLADGFAMLLLEREEDALTAGRTPLARLAGYGESADAHHLTQPHPEGTGAVLAMQRALARAGLDPDEIGYVNLHATSTPANDRAEVLAMRAIFGDALGAIPVHAVKPAVGHTLGGAGAVEAAITILVLAHQLIPPTLGLGEIDPELTGLDIEGEARAAHVKHAMSNSFGFGGCNTSLVFSRVADEAAS